MTPATALVLLGFGVGALMVAGRGLLREQPSSSLREQSSLRTRADALRQHARAAQEHSARISLAARELMAKWNEAEDVARREE